jgi:NMD protein affecting ribosome stability and mRNA decay
MGENANMMLTGILCCQCGQTLDEKVIDQELGIPIICEDCYLDLNAEQKKEFKERHENYFL